MFSLQQSDDHELIFNDLDSLISFNQQRDDQDRNDLVTMVEGTKKKRQNPSSSNPNLATGAEVGDENTQRKMVHREIEKQRRQEMAKLYGSLRGLLPLEFIKGKRSITDHMHQATNYIKQMQENIKRLSIKRDHLKNNISAIPKSSNDDESLMIQFPNTVSVSSALNGGIDISINSCLIKDGFSLSRVLNALVIEGINVISCTSTRVNQRSLHSIHAEMSSEWAFNDLSMLQQRLVAIANNSTQC